MAASLLEKLTIGTVNFGLIYGEGPVTTKVSSDEVLEIASLATEQGLKRYDTAIAYGNAENVLGRTFNALNITQPQICTKLPAFAADSFDKSILTEVETLMKASLDRLGVNLFSELLLHQASDLLKPGGEWLQEALVRIKEAGFAKRIGFSTYVNAELDQTLKVWQPDVIQIPASIADQRLQKSGILKRLRQQGTQIHARSVFLQGVLLEKPRAVHPIFKAVAPQLDHFHKECARSNIAPSTAALGYVAHQTDIDHVVIGVNTVDQLQQAICDIQTDFLSSFATDQCAWQSSDLLNPSNWPALKQQHSEPGNVNARS